MSTEEEISNEVLEEKIRRVEAKVDLMLIRIDEVLFAYNTAKGVTSFIKWLAAVITACGIVWTTIFHGKMPS